MPHIHWVERQNKLEIEVFYLSFFNEMFFVFILSSEKPTRKQQHNKQWYSEGVAVYTVVTGYARR